MEPVYAALCRRRPASGRLLDLSYLHHLPPFRAAVDNLGHDVVPYQGRHPGASIDRGEGLRSPDAVQKSGRGASRHAVRRWEEAGFLSQTRPVPNVEMRAHCETCHRTVSYFVLRGREPPRPPGMRC